MVAYTFYECDNRVMRYAETLVRHGHHVDIIALADAGFQRYEVMEGVHVYRVQKRIMNEKGPFSYLRRISRFLLHSSYLLMKHSLKRKYDLVHVHNLPNFLVFSAIVPKLYGAKLVLDIHDLEPELYKTKFQSDDSAWHVRILKCLEKMSIAFSDFVIVANDIWHERLCQRTACQHKIMTILNYPNLEIFHRRKRTQPCTGKFVVIYPGTMAWHHGLDIAIRAFDILKTRLPQAEFHIYGDGHEKPQLQQLVRELGLQDKVLFHGTLTLRQVGAVLPQAHVGIEPKRKNSFANEALSTKIFEFMATGIPVVAANTRSHTLYFDDSLVCFFEAGNPLSLAEGIIKMHDDVAYRTTLIRNASEYISKQNWEVKQFQYLQLVERLTGRSRGTEQR